MSQQGRKIPRLLLMIVLLFLVVSTAFAIYYVQSTQQISSLDNNVASLKKQVGLIQLETGNGTYPGINYFSNDSSVLGINPVAIYNYANASVVTVEGEQPVTSTSGQTTFQLVLGSGFVVVYGSSSYIITNFHVVNGDVNISVTFRDGNAYPGNVIGKDAYSDLAILSTNAPATEFHPIAVTPSSSLRVGAPVLAIGSPFGLSGSMTLGIVSQLGRTIQESAAGNFHIADVIQISTPINPGNSGGPLLNAYGQAVGITAAIVSGSQGLGFAVPSDTILREISSMIDTGSYNLHPYLGISMADMTYDLSKAVGTTVTYGALIESVVSGGPAANAGLKGGTTNKVVDGQQYVVGGDIIISINGTRITDTDAVSSWLEEHALPGQVVQVGIVRSGSNMVVSVTLGTRPPPT
jgi:S1-C subfamily serine protease